MSGIFCGKKSQNQLNEAGHLRGFREMTKQSFRHSIMMEPSNKYFQIARQSEEKALKRTKKLTGWGKSPAAIALLDILMVAPHRTVLQAKYQTRPKLPARVEFIKCQRT